MKLAAALITKGEGEYSSIVKSITSIIDYVDAVYLTINDKKAPKIVEWAKKHPKIHVSFFDNKLPHGKWTEDFAAIRNFNWSQVPSGFDWIYWQDADDILIRGENLKLVAGWADQHEKDIVLFDYWYGCKFNGEPSEETFESVDLPQVRERLIRPNKITWKGRLHETPVPVEGVRCENTVYHFEEKERPMVVMHLGAQRAITPLEVDERMNRNQELLELQLADEHAKGEADPRTLIYLMKIYVERNDETLYKKLIEMGKEYLTKSGWDEERHLCYVLMSKAYAFLGNEEEANKSLFDAIREYEKNPLTYLYLSRSFFNLKDYSACMHWLKIGLEMDMAQNASGMNNVLEMKALAAEITLKYYLNSDDKDLKKAYYAAKTLAETIPTEENVRNEEYLFDLKELNTACENIHKLIIYYYDINDITSIRNLCDSLPNDIAKQPSIQSLIQKFKKPRVWGPNEICYYASFGGRHFEQWDDSSLIKGIGGSETAVIRLAQEWTKMGYTVTVYCDPVKEGTRDGVTYLPWYKFNPRDRFNIFIQWRNMNLCQKVVAKKYLIDLHDVWGDGDYVSRLNNIDRIMVKSKYHRDFGKNVPNDKFNIISNGI